jgi:serine protease Do
MSLLATVQAPHVDAQEPTALEAALAIEQALVDAVARADKSVVAIARYRNDRPTPPRGAFRTPFRPGGSGEDAPNEFASGVVIDRQGYIVTNYHVLGNPAENTYKVWVKRRPFQAVSVVDVDERAVKAGDPWTDLAVLKIEADDLEPIAFGDTKNLKKGQIAIALGNPYNIARDGDVSASWGIISNVGRRAPASPESFRPDSGRETLYHYGGLIQTDAKLNLGTSGGALINLKGEMIGLITALAAKEGYEKSIGFAIPVDDVFLRTIETLKTGRKAEFGFLGVSPNNLNDAMRRNHQHGAVLTSVVRGTPAWAAGLKQGDVITHVNGQRIYDRDMLMLKLGGQAVESKIHITVERGAELGDHGRVVHATAKLTKKHIPSSRPAFSQIEDPLWRGMRVDYLSALPVEALTRSLQAVHRPEGVPNGVLAAVDVQRDSPAWRAGLRPGSLFTHVDDKRVTTPKEFSSLVATKNGDVRLRLISGTLETATVLP